MVDRCCRSRTAFKMRLLDRQAISSFHSKILISFLFLLLHHFGGEYQIECHKRESFTFFPDYFFFQFGKRISGLIIIIIIY